MALVEDNLHDLTDHASNIQGRPISASDILSDDDGSGVPSSHSKSSQDEEEEKHDYILNTLLKKEEPANRPRPKHAELDRTYSARSLNTVPTLEASCTTDDSKSSMSSAASGGDDKNWKTLDSVHSTVDTGGVGNGSFNDSCCSFASFGGGGSESSLNDAPGDDLALQRAAFTKLVEDPTPRRIMLKSQSVRIKRGPSFRGTGLSLIEESNSLLD